MLTLLYHQVGNLSQDQDPLHLAISPAQFEMEMSYLAKNGYHCMSLESVVKAQITGDRLPKRAFSITFDDGYQDNYERAFPILQKYGFTATIFLVPDRMGKTTKWWGLNDKQELPLMSWIMAQEMALNGIDFGSHTRSHARLKDLSREQRTWELATSKQIIEEHLGRPITLFAVPYELSTPELETEIEEQGYLGSCGSLLFPENRFNLWRRQCFGHDTMTVFKLKVSELWRYSVLTKYHSQFGNGIRSIRRRFKPGFQL